MKPWWNTPAAGTLALVTGCANFQAVNTTAGNLVSAASTWNAVADDYQGSCARRNLVSEQPSDCANEKKATASLEAANNILSAYFTALQQASTTSNFSVDEGIASLSTSVKSIPGANPAQVDAVSGLASFLASFATRSLEERTVSRLISNGAPKAEEVIGVMSGVVVPELGRVYRREANQTTTAFTDYVQKSGTAAPLVSLDCSNLSIRSLDTGTAFLLAQAYCTKTLALASKTAALENYKSSLATANQALRSLEGGKDKLDAPALVRQLISDISSLRHDIDQINQAF